MKIPNQHEPPREQSFFGKLVNYLAEELPWQGVAVIGFICFFFFHGLSVSVAKTFGVNPAALDFPLGLASGVLGSAGLVLLILLMKLRLRRR
jgi:hypothetical protein